MSSATSEDVLPLLVADLADADSLAILASGAQRNEVVMVPLVVPPVDRRRHTLEVYAPGIGSGIRFIAVPVGGPTPQGFPLKLEPFPTCPGDAVEAAGSPPDDDDTPTLIKAPQAVRTRPESDPQLPPQLTKGQTRDLGVDGTPPPPPKRRASSLPSVEEVEYTGRSLAAGKYMLEERVGSGGMGAVYRAHHRDLDKLVAVKVLRPSFQADPEFAKRFQAEALTMSRIDHPNVARVLDFGQEADGLLYLAMEFLEGSDLESMLEQGRGLPLERLARIMMQVCAALGHVHRHGIIHRDVKPTNIFLVAGHDDEEDVPTEIAKVLDFGIALSRGADGQVAGTPEYMSPEQCRGAALDARSDVYACGVILYELATGQMPFRGEQGDVLLKHVMEQPLRPSLIVPELDPLLEDIIMKAMAKEPAARHPSMRHLRNELRELLAPVMLDAPPPSMPTSEAAPAPKAAPTHVMDPAIVPGSGHAHDPAGDAGTGGASWLEGRDEGMSSFFTSLADTVEHLNVYHEGDELADRLAKNPVSWLSSFAATLDEAKFDVEAKVLLQAVHKLMKAADVETLAEIIRAMRRLLDEGSMALTTERTKWAGRILRTLREPGRLVPIVDRALSAPQEPNEELARVLVETQLAGAEAVLEGRLGRHGDPLARERFAKVMRAIGPAALPPIRSSLEAALARGERSGVLVEDLLRALPPSFDDATGKVVAEFLRGSTPETAALALVALAGVWGDRARPLLHGALGNPDDRIRGAALHGLRALRAIDALVLRHLEPMLAGTMPISNELRVAVAEALGQAAPAARSEAAALLGRAFMRGSSARTSAPTPEVLVAIARGLLALGVPNAQSAIRDRANASPEPLKRALLGLVG